MFIFKPAFNWVPKYRKKLSTQKNLVHCWDMKVLEDFQMGYENLKRTLDGLRVFLEKKNYISFCPGPGINNDHSLNFAQSGFGSSLKLKFQF